MTFENFILTIVFIILGALVVYNWHEEYKRKNNLTKENSDDKI